MQFQSKILDPTSRIINEQSWSNAFYIDGIYYTYFQFAERISAIRNVVHNWPKTEQIVALAIHDDIDTYASIFALWMEGKAYVPLHPNQPVDRNHKIINQIGVSYLLDTNKNDDYTDLCQVVNTSALICSVNFLDQWVETPDDDLAYILFTSGSTGVPKGVPITRCNIASFMDAFWQTGIKITPEDRCLQAFDLTFDVSVQSFLVALTRGACVYTVPYGQVKYLHVASLIQEQHISFGAMAPSMLTYLQPYFAEFDALSLKVCILTAEQCPVDLVDAWFKCAKNTSIYNFYGPTEATIYCTYYELDRVRDNLSYNGVVSIGKPLPSVYAIIIREDGSLVEGQEKGELCIAGNQITPGYWNSSEKNDSSFFVFNGMRYYHTRDLCYWDLSGNIMYCGRLDQQAKIQGFRVELGEIEYHARSFYNNEYRVIAIPFINPQNLTEIALFVESESKDTRPLVEYLRSKIPYYMIPSCIFFEPTFPLNKSEKVDRNVLKQLLL